jgi:hypothetical protein
MIKNKGEFMGHKGVSIRKPKRSRPFSSADISGTSNSHPDESRPVQSLVKDNRVSSNTGVINPLAGSNKKHKKGFSSK